MNNLSKTFSMLALSFLVVVGIAHAQSFSAGADPMQYTITPETPGPNSPVSIEAEGVGSFLGNATISWQADGRTISSGAGLSTFQFTTGAVGTVSRIHLIIDSPTQGVITHDFVFAPSVVNLIWEAQTSVPPFYLGKALYSAGSTLKVVAFPVVAQGKSLVALSKLSYQWSRGDNPDPAASGLGKNSYTFQGDEIQNSEDVVIDVYLGATKVARGEITIPATNPGLLLYTQDPLQGEILDQALSGAFNLRTQEITLKAEPYYFAKESIAGGALSYDWTLNGQETTGPNTAEGLLTLRQTGSGAGSAQVGVSLQNTDSDKLVQSASTALTLAFGQTGSALSNFFGL